MSSLNNIPIYGSFVLYMYFQEYRDIQNVCCLYTYYRQNNSKGKQNGVKLINMNYTVKLLNLLYVIQKYSGQYKNRQIINNKLLLIVLFGKCTNCTATAWR